VLFDSSFIVRKCQYHGKILTCTYISSNSLLHAMLDWYPLNSFSITILLGTLLSLQCVELMDSYATLLFTKITEIEPEEFCKQCGLCREVALFSGVTSDSTCVVCRHLLDEVTSKLQDPDAEVIALLFYRVPFLSCLCTSNIFSFKFSSLR
jgi:hypothetical protein